VNAVAGRSLKDDVERFILHEARLMDDHEYDRWLDLWAEDGLYWIPCGDDASDPARHVTIVYERKKQIADRVWRLKGKHAHAQRPRSKLLRVVSNIEIEREDGDDVTARSAFVLGEVRNNVQTTYFARVEHQLVQTGDGWRIRQKKVLLLTNDTPLGNLSFLL
jgi:3-phenylpropionate/cinnamic acid dioxygenase small subunit